MSNDTEVEYVPLAQALKGNPLTRNVDVRTAARWVRNPVRGHRLHARLVGSRLFTTAEALAAFLDAINSTPAGSSAVV